MKHDFDATDEYNEAEAEIDMQDLPAPPHGGVEGSVLEEDEKEIINNVVYKEETEKKHDGKIKIDLDSVEKLTGSLKFAAANLENSIAKVENVEKLSEILELLARIDQSKYEDFFNKMEEKINFSKIDSKIEKKIDFVMKKNMNQINSIFAKSAAKYEKYAEIFETPEIFDFFAEIEKLTKFRKNFKWKSIVISSILAGALTATAVSTALFSFYNTQIAQKQQTLKAQIMQDKKGILSVFAKADRIQIAEDANVKQIQFWSKSEKIKIGVMPNGMMFINLDKNVNTNKKTKQGVKK